MKIPESFWNFNIGHVGSAVAILVAGAFAWSGLKNDEAQLRKDHDALVIEVHQMDERGTHASQKGIYQESEHSQANEKRVTELERVFHEIGPKVERIDVSMGFLLKANGISPPK